jgi:hypothetical protein
MMVLEMGRPLNHLSAQVLHFFQPFATVIGGADAYETFTSFLERRGSLDYIGARIEAIDQKARADVDARPGRVPMEPTRTDDAR